MRRNIPQRVQVIVYALGGVGGALLTRYEKGTAAVVIMPIIRISIGRNSGMSATNFMNIVNATHRRAGRVHRG